MNQKSLAALDRDLAAALPALRRAAAVARELSIKTGTPFYVMRDGRVVDLNAQASTKRTGRAAARRRPGHSR